MSFGTYIKRGLALLALPLLAVLLGLMLADSGPSAAKAQAAMPVAIAVASASTTCTAGGTPAPFVTASPIATPAYALSMDSDGVNAYAAGGYSVQAAAMITQFGRYNPATDTWTYLAPVPDVSNGAASMVYAPNANKLYVFGGEDFTTGTVVGTTRVYDLVAGTWSTGAPMPDVRAFQASGYSNGKIYLVGGYNTSDVGSAQASVWEYDPLANTFTTTRMPIPHAVGGAGYGVINGHLYVAGGRDATNIVVNLVYDYNIAADTWTQRAAMPTAENVPGSAIIGGKLWVIGGGVPFSAGGEHSAGRSSDAPVTTNITQIYDPATDSWSAGPSLNQARSFLGATHVGDTALALGGFNGSTSLNTLEISVNSLSCQGTSTATTTAIATSTTAATATGTAISSTTTTSTAQATNTTQPGASSTSTTQPGASSTTTIQPVASATATSTVQPTACPLQFTDVPSMGSGSTFYSFVRCLVCRGIVSGYPCGGVNPATGGAEPCDADQHGYYRPGNNVSRGQLSKIIANSAGLNDPIPTGQQSFSDVPPSTSPSSFYVYIERLASTGAIAGYPCNTTNPQTGQFLPCDNANRPYFLPTNSATRGQISKIVALAAGYQDILPSGQQTFSDVPPNSPFYQYIEELASRHIIDGYDAASGRCEAHNPPYAAPCFLYNDFTTRGQMAKIAANAFYPNCQTPAEAVKR